MIALDVPGFGSLRLRYLLADFNGTLAVDGALPPGLVERLLRLAGRLELHVVTADTRGLAARALAGLPLRLEVVPPGEQAEAKLRALRRLGAEQTVALGNGRNDRLMLAEAALGVAVLGPEGCAREALLAADLLVPGPLEALDLLLDPLRLVSGLRS